jgi:hypothetical protein
LPTSHWDSVITLLPKEGKDTKEMKNWRPITLSNCVKDYNHHLGLKMSDVMDVLIDPKKRAYVNGRSVTKACIVYCS